MDYGFVLDSTFNLSWAEQRELVAASTRSRLHERLGARRRDLARRHHHRPAMGPGGAGPRSTGTSVTVAPFWTPTSLASQAATAAELTGGRFALGVGSGSAHDPSSLAAYDMPQRPVVSLMRDYLRILRGLLNGEEVNYTGQSAEPARRANLASSRHGCRSTSAPSDRKW